MFTFNFFQAGSKKKVTIDDRLPVKDGLTVNLKKSPNGAWWGPIMEKGAAKFYGRYENMDGGFTSESLYAMTGMPTVDWTHSKTTETELWNILDGYDKKHYIMTAGCVDVGADPVTGLKKDYLGLPTGHAYTVKGVKEYNGNKYV
jgi:hypothetical protein